MGHSRSREAASFSNTTVRRSGQLPCAIDQRPCTQQNARDMPAHFYFRSEWPRCYFTTPICAVETTVDPSDLMSAVRRPLASTAAIA
jgi:hypothetical protein